VSSIANRTQINSLTGSRHHTQPSLSLSLSLSLLFSPEVSRNQWTVCVCVCVCVCASFNGRICHVVYQLFNVHFTSLMHYCASIHADAKTRSLAIFSRNQCHLFHTV